MKLQQACEPVKKQPAGDKGATVQDLNAEVAVCCKLAKWSRNKLLVTKAQPCRILKLKLQTCELAKKQLAGAKGMIVQDLKSCGLLQTCELIKKQLDGDKGMIVQDLHAGTCELVKNNLLVTTAQPCRMSNLKMLSVARLRTGQDTACW